MPQALVGAAEPGHLGPSNTVSDGVEDILVVTAVVEDAGGQIRTAPAFAYCTVTLGASEPVVLLTNLDVVRARVRISTLDD